MKVKKERKFCLRYNRNKRKIKIGKIRIGRDIKGTPGKKYKEEHLKELEGRKMRKQRKGKTRG